VAFPSAHENEIEKGDAEALVKNGCKAVGEGANMPSTIDATNAFLAGGVAFGPGKAANAGGVSVSGLEQSQNAQRMFWTRDEVDKRLHLIMNLIHEKCVEYGADRSGRVNYVQGANRAGFAKVADAMLANGVF
jgi:glutamate dehydrogenase (NADP+)